MRTLRILALAAKEFRSDVTTHFDYPEIETYDKGREWAHRLTLRLFETEGGVEYPWSRRLTFRQGIFE